MIALRALRAFRPLYGPLYGPLRAYRPYEPLRAGFTGPSGTGRTRPSIVNHLKILKWVKERTGPPRHEPLKGTASQRKWSRGSNWKQRYRSFRHTARSAPLLAPCSAMCQRPQTSLVPGRSFRGGCFACATFCNNSTQPTTKNLWTEKTNSHLIVKI